MIYKYGFNFSNLVLEGVQSRDVETGGQRGQRGHGSPLFGKLCKSALPNPKMSFPNPGVPFLHNILPKFST